MKNKNKRTSKPQRIKILIIGDIHARRCTAKLAKSLGKTFKVMGAVMHGSMRENIMHLAHTEISYLRRDGVVIIWGGGNDP